MFHGIVRPTPPSVYPGPHRSLITADTLLLQASLHSLMHLLNFAINVQPDPVKFLQLTYRYWEEYYGEGIPMGMYAVPPGCSIVNNIR